MRIIETDDYEIVAALNEPVHALHAKLYPEYFQPFDYDAMKRFFKSAVSQPNHVFLLLEDDGQPLGYAWIEYKTVPENAFRKSSRSLFVHQIGISDSYQNKGYGSKLMERIYDMAKSSGIARVELDYWTDNESAVQFYRKHGFIKYHEYVYKDV